MDLVLNNLQWLICHKTKLNQTKPNQITSDETWIFEYKLESKSQSSLWKSLMLLWPKKARRSKPKLKVMLITFFDVKGIVHRRFLQQYQTISKSTRQSCNLYFSQSMRRHENYTRTNYGCFTTTMHLLTTSRVSSSFWPRGTLPYMNNFSVHWIMLCVFRIPKCKEIIKGT